MGAETAVRSFPFLLAVWAVDPALAASFEPAAETAAPSVVSTGAFPDLSLTYEIYLGGIRSGSVTVEARRRGDIYALAAKTRSRGLVDAVLGFRSHATTEGRHDGAQFRPTSHTADNVWQGENRTVRATFGADGTVAADVIPDAAGDKREPVAPEDRVGATDPITAGLLMTLAAGQEGGCSRSELVFDGRRLYRLNMEPDEKSKARPGEGEAWTCRITYERLGGRSADPWWPTADTPKEAVVRFARPIDGAPPLATRVTAWAGPARLAIELKAAAKEQR